MWARWTGVVLVVVLPAAAFSQEVSKIFSPEMSNAEMVRELKLLQTQVQQLGGNLTKALDQLNEQATQISQLKTDMTALSGQINDEIEKQRKILDVISRPDSSGRPIPRLSAIMDQSPDFKADMQDAVHRSLRAEGELHVSNKTSTAQTITINQQPFALAAGETRAFKVPVGTVSTQMPGDELKTFSVTAPHYRQNVDIVPKSTPTVSYSPVVVSPSGWYLSTTPYVVSP